MKHLLLAKIRVLLDEARYNSRIVVKQFTNDARINNFFKHNKNAFLKDISTYEISDYDFQGVGGIVYNDYLYLTSANGGNFYRFNLATKDFELMGCVEESRLKYSGMCKYNGRLFCFPRSANTIAIINPNQGKIEERNLNTSYNCEHHYGGTITDRGIIYLPPRNEDHILAIDTDTFQTHRIIIGRMKYRYSSIMYHPNGYIYLVPEYNQKVIKMDPQNEKISYIGDFFIDSRTLGVTIGPDGNIYGFLGFENGILRIDVNSDRCEIIRRDIKTRALGTELGVDGCLYSVPAYGRFLYRYDVTSDEYEVFDIKKDIGNKAFCAGGAIDKDGSIYMIPCYGRNLLKISFLITDNNYLGEYLRYSENNF